MTVLVESYGVFQSVAEFTPATGELGPERVRNQAQDRPAGCYGYLDGKLLVVFREGGEILLRALGRTFRVSSGAIRHESRGGVCTLHLDVDTAIGYQEPEEIGQLEFDTTAFVEAEDFDLGLFVANLAADPDRAGRTYTVQEDRVSE
ncbi:hypothetical protein ACGFX4_24350 [Kitasatospora sp. NPDC048365]|uniref:hypothetical protein n=1 Tax=Kitasatospora sp. NPDC048365 TaxID=3364050 RepID=UPI0037118BB2